MSRTLSSHYVFYDRLKDDGAQQQQLYASVMSKMSQAMAEASRVNISTAKLKAQADKEREKERALIEQYFGTVIPNGWGTGTTTQDFIDTFNECLNLKDAYERSKQLIMTSSSKGIFSWFGTYFEKQILQDIDQAAENFDCSSTAALQKSVEQWLETLVPKTLEYMINDTELENKSIDPKLKSAYKDLLRVIGSVQQQGSFAQQMAKIYHLDQVANEITKAMNTKQTFQQVKSLRHAVHIRGGYALEALYDAIAETIVPGKHGNIGSLGAKADNILAFDIDFGEIVNFLEEKSSHGRLDNVQIFNDLDARLNNYNRGFLVYVSDKNYTLNNGFKSRGGYSAGEDLNIQEYERLMNIAGQNVETFVGAILQLANGAVGQDMNDENFESIIAKNIAYLLFDDFNALGMGLTNGTNVLHIMNVNGILIPISSILYALVDAIEGIIEVNPASIVNVSIQHPADVKFPTSADQSRFVAQNGGNNMLAWITQRQEALEQTEISTHFLGNLRQLISGGMFR